MFIRNSHSVCEIKFSMASFVVGPCQAVHLCQLLNHGIVGHAKHKAVFVRDAGFYFDASSAGFHEFSRLTDSEFESGWADEADVPLDENAEVSTQRSKRCVLLRGPSRELSEVAADSLSGFVV